MTEEILSRIRGTSAAIITNGYTQKEAEPVLKEKGYLRNDYKYSEGIVADLHGKAEIDTAIKVSIDSIVRKQFSIISAFQKGKSLYYNHGMTLSEIIYVMALGMIHFGLDIHKNLCQQPNYQMKHHIPLDI